ncbi:MAG: dethiobiotin synthase, partial [Burkholderiales bacterium]|nr:dethiobiotin synthase [Burkholderiales bacterium]
MKRGFFVTGTDTGAGKTTVSCALLHAFSKTGKSTAGMKPVASGGDDAEKLMQASSVAISRDLANPYNCGEPLAPHIAAQRAGIEIDLEFIVEAYGKIEADVVIVEGIGGFLVPLNRRQDASDLARRLGLPVILVVGMRLGAINHALLTGEAIKSRGLRLAGWVANRIDPDVQAFEEMLDAIRQRINAPLLCAPPFDPDARFL